MSAWLTLLMSGWLLVGGLTAWVHGHIQTEPQRVEVTVTAFNSVHGQTANDPTLTAFGHSLAGADNSIAVSRDLLRAGMDDGTVVKIQGLPGIWVVRDKMHRRWNQRIDIHMGKSWNDAREFGKQTRTIYWEKPVQPENTKSS